MSVGVWRKQVFNSRKEENFPTAGVVQRLMAMVVRPVRGSVQDENRAGASQPHKRPPQIESVIEVPEDLLNHSQLVLGSLSPRIPRSVSLTLPPGCLPACFQHTPNSPLQYGVFHVFPSFLYHTSHTAVFIPTNTLGLPS